jgi:hypothetical protein
MAEIEIHGAHFETGTGTLAVAEFAVKYLFHREPVPVLKSTAAKALLF